MWINTEFKNREELVNNLTSNSSNRCLRGNFVWTITEGKLIAFKIRKENNIWQYIKLTESEFTNDCITCPKKYLAVTQVENQEWRSSLELEKSSNYKLKLKIREAFKEAKEQKKQLIVETDSVEIPVVTIEFDVPLKGRHKNGKLYFIPLRRIKSWTIQ